jgi:hypothetical protein
MSDLLNTTTKKNQNSDSTFKVNPFQSRGFGLQQKVAESVPATKAELWESYQQSKHLNQKGTSSSLTPIQAKLTIGEPGDKYEQEADSMAAQVMQMPEPGLANSNTTNSVQTRSIQPIQRACTECQEEKKEESKPEEDGDQIQAKEEYGQTPELTSIQRKVNSAEDPESSSNLESQLNGSKGGGSPLTDEVRGFMEPRFGADFSGVRVHTGSDSVQMNGALNAQAFAHGSDIYFGAGKSPGNNELTAHELTHVVQQTESIQQLSKRSVIGNIFEPILQCDGPQTPIYSDEDNKIWKDIKGVEMIASVSGELQSWLKFRSSPNSGAWKAMPGASASKAIAKVADIFQTNPRQKERATRELINSSSGPNSLMYLNEMISFWPVDFAFADTVFNGINRTLKPQHRYTLEVLPTEALISKIPGTSSAIKINTVRIAYQNNFGWFWSEQLGINGIQIGVSVEVESGKDEGRKTSVKPGVAPLKIDFSGISIANPTPQRYWGWENFNNAKVIAGSLGASASIKLMGAGGDFGVGIPFVSFITSEIADDLSFPKIETTNKLTKTPTASGVYKAGKDNKMLTLSFGTGSIGTGLSTVRAGTLEHTTYSLSSTLEWVSHQDKLHTTVNPFDTGSNTIPSTAISQLQALLQSLQGECARSQNDYELVKQANILPEKAFTVHLDVVGWSSRVWKGTKDEQLKREQNFQLSFQRAEAVSANLSSLLPGKVVLGNVTGMGQGVVPPGNKTPVAVADDEVAGALWKKEYEQWQEDNYKNDYQPTRGEKVSKVNELDARYGRNSDDPLARRTDITVWYERYEMQGGKLPNQSLADAPPQKL